MYKERMLERTRLKRVANLSYDKQGKVGVAPTQRWSKLAKLILNFILLQANKKKGRKESRKHFIINKSAIKNTHTSLHRLHLLTSLPSPSSS